MDTTTTNTNTNTNTNTSLRAQMGKLDEKQIRDCLACKNPMRSAMGSYLIGMGYVACARYVEAVGKGSDQLAAMREDARKMLMVCAKIAGVNPDAVTVDRMLIKLPSEPDGQGIVKLSGMGQFRKWLNHYSEHVELVTKKPLPVIGEAPVAKLPSPSRAHKDGTTTRQMTPEERAAWAKRRADKLRAELAKLEAETANA